MKKTGLLLVVLLCLFCCAFSRQESLFVVPKGWPAPAYDFKANPLTADKIALGRSLFFDPLLSRNNTISCASCHAPQTAFTHIDHDLSHGIEDRIGKRNSPALFNLAWSRSFMWDGAVHHLDVQSLAPITNPLEMDEKLEHVVQKLQSKPAYTAAFRQAFGDTAITGERTLKALSQFLLSITSTNAKYDQVMRGEAVFTETEAAGYQLFKANCASCHREPLFTNNGFASNGLPPDTTLNDRGRMQITGRQEDERQFKIPSLRNVEVSYPYMHDGRFKSLQMVLFHYTDGIEHHATLAPQLAKGITLTETDKRALIAFLRTLTDETFLHESKYQSPPQTISP